MWCRCRSTAGVRRRSTIDVERHGEQSVAERGKQMAYPAERKCAMDHAWIRITVELGEIGITGYAQRQRGDVVCLDLPDVGRTVHAGESFRSIESVKAVSDLFAPMSGEVIAV